MTSLARPRLVVLGLDGLPHSLALKLAERLPNLARIVSGSRPIRAELPELSPVNWTSMFTACGPGAHRVTGFVVMDPKSYALRIANFRDVAVPTVFDRLGEKGFVSRVINLPNTYPARPLRGMLVSGFVADDLRRAVHPPVLASRLATAGYKLEADTTRGSSDLDFLLAELRETLLSRLFALDMLWPDLDWDLFVHVFTETDRLFHFFLPAVAHEDHPDHGRCMAFLAEWDRALGVVLDRYEALPDPKRLLVMADHGFTETKTEVDLNRWLGERGMLVLGPSQSDHAAAEWEATRITPLTRAFALDPGRIYIHERGRFARGVVTPEHAPVLAAQIREELLGLTWHGERVMQEVHFGRDLYPGLEGGPDLVCEARPGFDLKAKFDRTEVFGLHGRYGTHTAGDTFFRDDAEIAEAVPEVTRVRDVGRAILQFFNLDEPECP